MCSRHLILCFFFILFGLASIVMFGASVEPTCNSIEINVVSKFSYLAHLILLLESWRRQNGYNALLFKRI